MSTVILACSSLAKEIVLAKSKLNVDYPVVYLDRKYHVNPLEMREKIIESLKNMDSSVDTVLVAMGYCGGSWENILTDKKIVLPRVDDCITLLLHTDETPNFNLKEIGHFYFRELDNKNNSLESMRERLCKKMGEEEGDKLFKKWFQSFTDIDIIDTTTYDSYNKLHLEQVNKDAQLINCKVNHKKGSNIIIEKLLSGQWDKQFLIVEPKKIISKTTLEIK